MKILKSFYLLFMCILLLITALIFQTSFALKNTVFSPQSYQKIFTSDESYNAFIKVVTKETKPELKQVILESIDSKFYNKFSTDLIKGVFDFLNQKTTKLPVIDIRPIQDKVFDTALNKELDKYGLVLANEDKNKITDEFKKQINLPTKIDFNDIAQNKMDLANNKLDKEVINVYKSFKSLPTLAIIIMILIIIAVLIVAISPTAVLRWIGATSLITGLLTLASSKTISKDIIDNKFNELITLVFTKLIDQYRSILTTETYIFIGIGILLLALSFIPVLREKSTKLIKLMHDSPKYKTIKISRIVTATVLTILIPLTLYIFSIPVITAATDAGNGIVNTDKAK